MSVTSNSLSDPQRLAALRRATLLNGEADEGFDRIARLARAVLRVPVALVSIVDVDRQIFKGRAGLPEPWATSRETPINQSFCRYAVESGEPLIIDDARVHPLVHDNPSIELLGVIAYAGIPLVTKDGQVLGSFCVIGHEPRHWTDEEIALLKEMAAMVMTGIELRTEITDRRATEAALRESEQRYHFVTESLPVQVWTALPDGRLDFVTERCARYFGKTPDEIIGEGWLSVLHPDDVQGTVQRWTHALRTGTKYEVEFRLLCAEDGSYRWHLGRAYPMKNEAGEVTKWVGTNTDIDDQKRTMAERDEALRQASEASAAKTKFLNMVSHELRTPLGAIGGYTDLLEMGARGPVPPEQLEYLKRIKHNQQHLLRMINDLLGYAKIEAGQTSYDMRDTPVEDIVTAVEAMIQPQLEAKHITYRRDLADPGATVYADPDKTRQIVLNLMSNAVKFTPAHGTVAIRATKDDGAVRITVRDTGVGIAPDKLDFVFEPFVQVPNRLTSGVEGTGLGLAISREFARGMGGEVTVESSVGVGSAFTVQLQAVGGGR
jgi:PAS domain S-box-containing protein